MTIAKLLAASALALVSTAVTAKTASGSINGISWSAESRQIGVTSTGTVATGGDPIYLATNAQGYSGVAGLLMRYDDGSAFVCSGTLTGNSTIVTAGHCVSDGGGVKARGLTRVQAIFVDNAASLADTSIYSGVFAGTPAAGVTAIDVSYIKVNSAYTGQVIDQNDIALLRLSNIAPAYAQRYDIDYSGNLTGLDFNDAGYGVRSTVGGACGTAASCLAGTGRRRQTDNRYDFAWGDADFGGIFTDFNGPGQNIFGGNADITYSFVSDFDNGLAANDTSCRLIVEGIGGPVDPKWCNLGRGATEGLIGGGDSGGPGFVNGKLASVNSYGLTFGFDYGDINDNLDNTFGEFGGYVPTYIHQNFIQSFAAIPEPSQWALMIGGFGFAGVAARRRKAKVNVTFA